MTAAVYAAEIRSQYDCERCALSGYEWDRLGRCVGPLGEGGAVVVMENLPSSIGVREYPARWPCCPRSYLRDDLRPSAAIARVVSHAVSAKVERLWPDLPARLLALVNVWHAAEGERMNARHEALTPKEKST